MVGKWIFIGLHAARRCTAHGREEELERTEGRTRRQGQDIQFGASWCMGSRIGARGDLERDRETTRCKVKTKLYSPSLSFICLYQALTQFQKTGPTRCGMLRLLCQAMKWSAERSTFRPTFPISRLATSQSQSLFDMENFWQENISVLWYSQ